MTLHLYRRARLVTSYITLSQEEGKERVGFNDLYT